MSISAPAEPATTSVHARVRALSLPDAMRLARSGDFSERVALERLHGKLVWEALLRNPGLTVPEVLRIAGMGLLPSPLVDLVVGNPGWLAVEEVRRTLLANRALRGQAVLQVLRRLSRAELALVPRQSAYPHSVREAARRLVSR